MSSFHNHYSTSLDVDKLNNIFISGVYWDSLISRSKFLTLKYNTSGILQWYRLYLGPDTFPGGYYDIAYINIADGAGNVYVAGNSRNNSDGDDIFIIKYNTDGDTIWTARYDGNHSGDWVSGMVKDKFGNIYITGYSGSFPGTGTDYTTLKYDSSGNKQWEAHYNNIGNSSDYATAIAIDSFQNVYVTGYCDNQYILYEYVTIKYNQLGIQQWATKYTSYYNDAQPNSVAVDKNNCVYVTGYVDYPDPKKEEFLTVKYDSSGNEVWAREFGTALFRSDVPRKIHIDSSGNVLIDGSSIVKYNSDGMLLWADSLGHGYGALDNANNFYVTTSSNDTIHYNWIQTTRYKPNGYKDWTIWWNSSGYWDGVPREILVDMNNNFYIRANAIDTNGTIILLKYSQVIGIWGNSSEIPDKFELYQNYPNPFNPVTTIKFDLPKSTNVKIKIYDLLGREVKTLMNEFKNAGSYEVEWNANQYASGIYIYRIEAGNYIDTKKMVLLK